MGEVTIGYTSDKELQANSQQEVGLQSINMMFGGAHGMAVVSHVVFSGLFGSSGYLWQAVVVGHNELEVSPCFVGPIVIVVRLGGILTLEPASHTA